MKHVHCRSGTPHCCMNVNMYVARSHFYGALCPKFCMIFCKNVFTEWNFAFFCIWVIVPLWEDVCLLVRDIICVQVCLRKMNICLSRGQTREWNKKCSEKAAWASFLRSVYVYVVVSNCQFGNWIGFLISWWENMNLPLLLLLHHDLLCQ